MGKIKHSVEELIGNTPLIEIDSFEKNREINAHILLKLEFNNPLGSMKDRVANAMIDDLEKKGRIKPGDYLVECSSGNTAIALAAIGGKRGYKVRIYIGGVSEERIKILKAFGAEIVDIFADEAFGAEIQKTGSAVQAITNLLAREEAETGKHFEFTKQGNNFSNPEIHSSTTGPEIWEQTDGKVDVLIGGVGSGGSIRGLSDYFRSKNPDFKSYAFNPTEDSGEAIQGVHRFTALPEGDMPTNINTVPYDEIVEINKDEAFRTVNAIAREEGLLVGITTGAGIYIAAELAKKPEYSGKNIIVLAVDDGVKYLSTDLFDDQYR